MARFLLIAIAIFLILNIAAITALLRIHPRRRRLIITIAVICNLMWLFLPLLNARTDFSRAVRAILGDRKSTRLNSSHLGISYAVFCLKKKTKHIVWSYVTQRTAATHQ